MVPSLRKMTSRRRSISRALDDAGPTPTDHEPAFGHDHVGREFVLRRDDDALRAHVDGMAYEARIREGVDVHGEQRVEIVKVLDTARDGHVTGTVVARSGCGEIYYVVVYANGNGKRARGDDGRNGETIGSSDTVIVKDAMRQHCLTEVKHTETMPPSLTCVQIQARVEKGSLNAPEIGFRYMQGAQWKCMKENEFEDFQIQQKRTVHAELDKQDVQRVLIDAFDLGEIKLDEACEEVQRMLNGQKTGMHKKILYDDGYTATVWYQDREARKPHDIVADDGKVQGREITIPMRDGMSLAVILTIANTQFCIFPEDVGFHPHDGSKEAMCQKTKYIRNDMKFYNQNNRRRVW